MRSTFDSAVTMKVIKNMKKGVIAINKIDKDSIDEAAKECVAAAEVASEDDCLSIAEKQENGIVYCSQRNRFFEGDTLEVMEIGKKPYTVVAKNLRNEDGEVIESTNHPMMKFTFECDLPIEDNAILRKQREEAGRVII